MKHSEAFERLVSEIKSEVTEVSCEDVREKQEREHRFHFIDVREDHEWNEGRAIGSAHIGRGILERDIENHVPGKSDEIVLYCGGGYRSALAAVNLQKMGYTHVLSMAGGIRRWRELALPEERG